MNMPFMQNDAMPTFLPKTTLETAPSQSFLIRFDPDAAIKKEKQKVNKNVYNKQECEKSSEISADPITEYDYVKFYVDLSEVISQNYFFTHLFKSLQKKLFFKISCLF